jgi:hypothetical protein
MVAGDGTMFVGSRGNGVYRSTDGGLTWNRPAGGPSTVERADVGPDNSYVAVTDGSTHDVWRLVGTTWTKITPPTGRSWHSATVDPFNANRIVVADDGGAVIQTTNAGATWGSVIYNPGRAATDVPWLAWTDENYMSNGDMRFDPVTPNKLWFAQGIGVWTTSLSTSASTITWNSLSAGIEQLVTNEIVAPPGGSPVMASWDRPLFSGLVRNKPERDGRIHWRQPGMLQ